MPLKRKLKFKELSPQELRWTCDPKMFAESTTKIKPMQGIVGQERAIKALRLGVDLRSQGYNIFITGLSGTGKFTTVKKMLETISPECPTVNDYAYVNNFKDPDRPILLLFPGGQARKFKDELESSLKFLQENIPQVLESKPVKVKKEKLQNEFGEKQKEIMSKFEDKLKKDGFALGQIKMGEMPRPEVLPIIENQPVMISQLGEFVQSNKLTKKQAETITKKYTKYQTELQSIAKKALKLGKEFQEKMVTLERDSVRELINETIDEIVENFNYAKIPSYLETVKNNIMEELEVFKGIKPTQEKNEEGYIIDYLQDYEVNIILDNSELKECPVIIETSPSYTNLFGTIEKYRDASGSWFADFSRIKAGSLLRANGGYLVLNAMDTFTEPGVWRALKRILLYGKIEIQDNPNFYQYSPSVLKPEPIEIDTKIILIGNNRIYSILSDMEDDFNKIFKVKADFDYEMKNTENALTEYAKVIKKLIDNENLLDFDNTALAKIAEYGARYAGRKEKLTTRFAYIADLARESSFWAKDDGAKIVKAFHVNKAYEASRERHSMYESKMSEMIHEGNIMIDTDNERIGQINGLAVYGTNNHSFGKPSRITASVGLGNGNIINVEREAGLSGSSHNKGVLIIGGYFREKFGRKVPLSFSASLVFEQGYGKIDGDSASVTEICALLSCISEIPIKQSLAITGSVNQKGDIQPIGGVNEKIEGFFDICNSRGLTGKQGVIIPQQNVSDLMLKEEIIKAVGEKNFHIYSVSNVDGALEILTGYKAGTLMKTGKFETNTIYYEVERKLKELRTRIKPKPENKPEVKTKTSSSRKKK